MMRRNGNERAVTTATLKNFDFAFFLPRCGFENIFRFYFPQPRLHGRKVMERAKSIDHSGDMLFCVS